MSILAIVEIINGRFSKASLETLAFTGTFAQRENTKAEAMTFGKPTEETLLQLGNCGIAILHTIESPSPDHLADFASAGAIGQAIVAIRANLLVLPHNTFGKSLGGQLSGSLKAGLVSGVCDFPRTDNGFVVKRSVFSGKAFATTKILSPIKIITLNPNSFDAFEGTPTACEINIIAVTAPEVRSVLVDSNKTGSGKSLADASIVVSGGKGMKGPENWGMLEQLANALDGVLACSRPVSDAHWRPHEEHVGQTGLQIAPNLYIAVGISGAIQHLAGVNRSKCVLVINKDPEAPFFKSADFGIIGDAFEVVPLLTKAIEEA